jgi:hypothetical protein
MQMHKQISFHNRFYTIFLTLTSWNFYYIYTMYSALYPLGTV